MDMTFETITKKIRNFNRFYTRIIGAVNQSVLNSPFSLAEARVLYEIKHTENPTASEINVELELDPGYLSRIIRRFEHDELLTKERSALDGRAYLLKLTPRGEHVLTALEKASDQRTSELVESLPGIDMTLLLNCMSTIETVLSGSSKDVIVRPARPGEAGEVAARHMELYEKEYGLDKTFEHYLFDGITKFLKNRDAGRAQMWIAEHNGRIVGSVAIDRFDEKTAQLRWRLVNNEFRKLGIGKMLMDKAMEFSRTNLYHRVFLWTFSSLRTARHLYELYGFSPTEEVKHTRWGQKIVEERWDILLVDPDEEA